MVWTRKPSFRTFKFTFFPKQEKKEKKQVKQLRVLKTDLQKYVQ